jgi:hypothetical protein
MSAHLTVPAALKMKAPAKKRHHERRPASDFDQIAPDY